MFRITMENIIKNASLIEQTTKHLQQELSVLRNAYNQMRIKTLTEENSKLSQQVQVALQKLVQLENNRGVKQVPIPNSTTPTVVECTPAVVPPAEPVTVQKPVEKKEKKLKADGDNKKTEKEPKKKPEPIELPVDVGRLDMRVGQIIQVDKHPDADSLYVSKIMCGEEQPRTVVSGLVKYVPIEALRGRKVVVLCNLKPAKMRGVLSEAMVMCASTPEAVEVLIPPGSAQPGDPVECDGYIRQPDAQMNPKKKIFETVAPDLKTNDILQACYKNQPLLIKGANIVSKSLKNVQIK